ncbi:MAG: hypothetical protein A3D44_00600 [Candidatus Staskawiczbacteria bacterium RIFCSPHIGHO2_02_FULL_42_22]|uniref:Uncharacterized protein n=1 Tax=Candidatus Staskawiczbacteria bacterium RIFCSPHIGHO2_02_FULL_42_22 TaxID=1802207 RepID=A0A1G2I179_9BACT|nr:MAG: hypothetical protein A3D44_00600 [Candidatus Staskawiczbacteria bacterium RIFCSPHIGHO2_02_FULL_42_22]
MKNMAWREKQIIALCESGYSDSEIMEKLALPFGTIRLIIEKLLRQGRIKPRQRGSKKSAFWRKLEDSRTQTIIIMIKERATLQEIADHFGFTRQRASQIIGCIKEMHGTTILLATTKSSWTVKEVANELDLDIQLIYTMLHNGQIPYRKRGKNKYLIDEEGMRLLRAHPQATGERICPVCKKSFISRYNKRLCSKECLKEHRKQRDNAYSKKRRQTLDS